jgi:putative ABC transport system substrate-binding protein
MDRRTVLSAVVVGLLSAPLAAEGQQAGKVPRVGLVASDAPVSDVFGPTSRWPHWRVLLAGLRELGWVEGQSIQFERRSDEGQPDRRHRIFEELVRLRVDVVVTLSSPMVEAALDATRTIPIVMVTMAAPVEKGLATSLARPGGNLTGLSVDVGAEIYAKRLQLLKEAVPRIARVAVLTTTLRPFFWPEIEAAARALGLTLAPAVAGAPDQFERAFVAASRDRADALFVHDHLLNVVHDRLIVRLAARHRLPAVYPGRSFVESGGLIAYSPDMLDNFRRAATYVDKVLRGAKPGDLPIEQPTKFELLINLKTAKAVGPKAAAVAAAASRSGVRVVDRRAFVSGVALALLAAPLIARAQQAGKIPRIGLLWPGISAAPSPLREAFLDGLRELGYVEGRTAAQTLGVQVVSLEVRDPSGLTAAFETARKERVQAVLVLDCSIIHPSASKIVGLAAASRLPGMYPFRGYADAGGLMAYSPDVRAQFRRAAAYIDKILKGAKPGDLPVEQPTTFELVINMKTAKALGLTIPPAVLVRADQVIE